MSADSDRPAIRAEGLVKNFGKTRALDGFDLEVAAGIVFGLLGPNGAGRRRRCGSSRRCSSPTGVTPRSRASTACATAIGCERRRR
jgi:ABC-type phosphonate transport system ATPase subunit